MYTPGELKRGLLVEVDGAPHAVESVQTSSPTARGGNTITRVKLRNLATRTRVEKSFRGNETIAPANVAWRAVDFLYTDPTGYHFMDTETYEQFTLPKDELEWEANFLVDGIQGLRAIYHDEAPLALELPNTVTLEITETNPAVKGNSATGRTKAATLQTGYVVQIPEHIDQGTRITVDTRTGDFVGRAKD